MNKAVTYAALQELLHQLGFQETLVPGSHVVFNHPEPNTRLIYRLYRPQDSVDGADLAVTRRFLDLRGLLEEDEFERILHQPAA